MKYEKLEHFVKRGQNFNIVVIHSYREGLKEHSWCLYVILFPAHPLYKKAIQNDSDYDTDLGNKIYPWFHGGCTFYNKQSNYVKIGCDYMHIHDDEFVHESEMPAQVDLDAEDMFEYFDKGYKEAKE